jgi:prevent-host-death family protein
MDSVSIRELRNNGASTLARVERGEALVVTRDGAEIATLVPRERSRVSTAQLIERRRRLPAVDPAALRADIDDVLDPSL